VTQASDTRPHALVVAPDDGRWSTTRATLHPRFTVLRARDDAEACDLLERYASDLSAIVIEERLPGSQLEGRQLARLITGAMDAGGLPTYARTVPLCPESLVVLLVESQPAATGEDGVEEVAWPPTSDVLDAIVDAERAPATPELLRKQRDGLAARLRRANRRLSEQEATDRLTGMPNRHALEAALHRQLAQASRSQIPISLLLIEAQLPPMQHARPAAGCRSEVLAGITELLRANLRLGDLCGRYGYATLAVLLLGSDLASARAIAERIRHGLETQSLTGLAATAPATVCMGLATIDQPSGPANAQLLVEAAQKALDSVAQAGGNQLGVADPISL
jgi:diguanylate cyclase (GGDEF)-like protein